MSCFTVVKHARRPLEPQGVNRPGRIVMHANLRRLLASIALLSLFGCADCDNGESTPDSTPTPAPTPVALCPECGTSTNKEKVQPQPYDPAIYHHLAEGSELIPLVWLKALNDFSTGSDNGLPAAGAERPPG